MFKQVIIIVFIGIVLLITTSYLFFHRENTQTPFENKKADQNEKIIEISGHKLTVEIADEPYEQTQGLSDRQSLGQNNGMLFVFPQPLVPAFWMKDMHIDLDMIWIDSESKIVSITKNISPNTFPEMFKPPSLIKYVLEVNAGWSDKNKIKNGDKVTGLY